jgi:hypothetical protein
MAATVHQLPVRSPQPPAPRVPQDSPDGGMTAAYFFGLGEGWRLAFARLGITAPPFPEPAS